MPTVLYSIYMLVSKRIAPAGAVGYISDPLRSIVIDPPTVFFFFAALVVFAQFGFYILYNE